MFPEFQILELGNSLPCLGILLMHFFILLSNILLIHIHINIHIYIYHYIVKHYQQNKFIYIFNTILIQNLIHATDK